MFRFLSPHFSHSLISFILSSLFGAIFRSWQLGSLVSRYIIYTIPKNWDQIEDLVNLSAQNLNNQRLRLRIKDWLFDTYLLFILLPFFLPPNPYFFSLYPFLPTFFLALVCSEFCFFRLKAGPSIWEIIGIVRSYAGKNYST